jgi:hypothetical protein
MRHPFDGIIIPPEKSGDGTHGERHSAEETPTRREWLLRMLATSAGMLGLPLTGIAVPPPTRPSNPATPRPTTQALGEEGNPPIRPKPTDPQPDPTPTTLALGEEGNPPPKPKDGPKPPPPTTRALGEEGNPPRITTLALGEEGNTPPRQRG